MADLPDGDLKSALAALGRVVIGRSKHSTRPLEEAVIPDIEVSMTISRRSLLTVVPAGFTLGALALRSSAARADDAPRGRTFHRQAGRQGDGGRVFLSHLHPLRGVRADDVSRGQDETDRHGRSQVGVPRLPAGSGRADRRDGRALSAGRSLRAVRRWRCSPARTAGHSAATTIRPTSCGRWPAWPA